MIFLKQWYCSQKKPYGNEFASPIHSFEYPEPGVHLHGGGANLVIYFHFSTCLHTTFIQIGQVYDDKFALATLQIETIQVRLTISVPDWDGLTQPFSLLNDRTWVGPWCLVYLVFKQASTYKDE